MAALYHFCKNHCHQVSNAVTDIFPQPWFLDGNLTSNFRGKPHIDGSFLAQTTDYVSKAYAEQPRLILDFKRDPIMKNRALEAVKVISKQGIWDILEQGNSHAKIMDRKGEFSLIPRH